MGKTKTKSIKAFRSDLKALMLEYGVEISFDISDGSDTHGLYGEKLIARIARRKFKLCDGFRLTAKDL